MVPAQYRAASSGQRSHYSNQIASPLLRTFLLSQLKRLVEREFLLFLAVGATAASVTIASRAMLNWFVIFEFAVAISHLVGLTIAFTLNRFIVFTSFKGALLPAYARFFVVNLASLVIATVTSSILYRFVFAIFTVDPLTGYLSHVFGLGASTIPSYVGHSHYSFRDDPKPLWPAKLPPRNGRNIDCKQ